jgi:hypothetical protein
VISDQWVVVARERRLGIEGVGDTMANVPLVLGVVGHNKPTDIDTELKTIRESVSNFFRVFKARYPHTPIVVLSSLAEGADQIVAKEAIDAGCSVGAPLPLPCEVYGKSTSFTDDAPRDQFLAWVREGKVSGFVVPLPNGPDPDDPVKRPDWEKLRDDEEKRRMCYANTGGYIVRHSLALIALWDGKSGEPSGTDDMVQFKLSGKVPECFPWRRLLEIGSERGPVVMVRTPKKSHERVEGAGEVRVIVSTKLEEGPKSVGVKLREFGSRLLCRLDGAIQLSRKYLRLAPVIDRRDEFWDDLNTTLVAEGFQIEEVQTSVWERPPGALSMFRHRVLGALGLRLDSSSAKEFWKYRETARNIDEFSRDIAEAGPASITAPYPRRSECAISGDWSGSQSRLQIPILDIYETRCPGRVEPSTRLLHHPRSGSRSLRSEMTPSGNTASSALSSVGSLSRRSTSSNATVKTIVGRFNFDCWA